MSNKMETSIIDSAPDGIESLANIRKKNGDSMAISAIASSEKEYITLDELISHAKQNHRELTDNCSRYELARHRQMHLQVLRELIYEAMPGLG